MVKFLLDMNDDCVEHVIKRCYPDSIVAMSQTCKKLKSLATPLFKNHTKYNGEIECCQDVARVKRTIGSIGNHLVEINVNAAYEYFGLNPVLFERLPQKCPRLNILRIESSLAPNIILETVHTFHQLQHLSIRYPRVWFHEPVEDLVVIGLARQLTQLQTFEIGGLHWNEETIVDFLIEARSLKRFSCDVGAILFDADHEFLEAMRSSENQATIINLRLNEILESYDELVVQEYRYNSIRFARSPSDTGDDSPSDTGDDSPSDAFKT